MAMALLSISHSLDILDKFDLFLEMPTFSLWACNAFCFQY